MLRSVLLSALCGISTITTAFPVLHKRDTLDPEPCLGNCSWIHDPQIFRDGSRYYRFSTSGNIAIATAPSLSGPWEYQGALLTNGTKIVVDEDRQDIWAPNVFRLGGTFYCYYSVSYIGSQDSQIGVATSESLDPGTWTDHGSINMPRSDDYNLIDPAVFRGESDNDSIHFSWGSYWNGIYQTTLREDSMVDFAGGSDDTQEPVLNNIIRNTNTSMAVVEGATTFKWEGNYYVFFSAGNCCAVPPDLPEPGREYRVLVCRGDRVEGPFFDQQGRDCMSGGGTMVLGSHGDVYAPGGQGVMFDESINRVVMYYHYIKPSVGYAADQFLFGYNFLSFENGWPVISSA